MTILKVKYNIDVKRENKQTTSADNHGIRYFVVQICRANEQRTMRMIRTNSFRNTISANVISPLHNAGRAVCQRVTIRHTLIESRRSACVCVAQWYQPAS